MIYCKPETRIQKNKIIIKRQKVGYLKKDNEKELVIKKRS